MKARKLLSKMPSCGREGFSLIELMVVVGILGILAFSVGAYINATATKLKSFVFNTKMRFNQARFEAVKRSRNVYLDFDIGDDGIDNGFTIWVDDNDDEAYNAWNNPYINANADPDCNPGEGDCNDNDVCDPGEGDCVIARVTFVNKVSGGSKHGPEIYSNIPAFPSGGPGNVGPGGKVIGDGIAVGVGNERFQFRPDGDSKAGTAYFYFPTGPDGAKEVAAGPWAIIVNTVGRIRVDEWRSSGGWQVND